MVRRWNHPHMALNLVWDILKNNMHTFFQPVIYSCCFYFLIIWCKKQVPIFFWVGPNMDSPFCLPFFEAWVFSRPGKPATKVTGMTGERAGQNGVAGNLGTACCCVSATCQLWGFEVWRSGHFEIKKTTRSILSWWFSSCPWPSGKSNMADVRRMAWSVSVRTGSLPKALRKAITKALLLGAMPSPRRRIGSQVPS